MRWWAAPVPAPILVRLPSWAAAARGIEAVLPDGPPESCTYDVLHAAVQAICHLYG